MCLHTRGYKIKSPWFVVINLWIDLSLRASFNDGGTWESPWRRRGCNRSERYLSLYLDWPREDWRVLQKLSRFSLRTALYPARLRSPVSSSWSLFFSIARVTVNINVNRRTLWTSLTADDHVDVFDVRRGDVVAGLAFIAARLVPHYADDVQVFLSVQRLRCRRDGGGGGWREARGGGAKRERDKKEEEGRRQR